MKPAKTLVAIMAVFLGACSGRWEQTKPVLSPVTESVYAAGTVKAANQYTVYPVVSGILQQILVRAGDTVRPGAPLFRLEDGTVGLQAENARLALELSRQNNKSSSGKLREAQLNVNATRERYRLDSVMFRRQQRLWEQKIGSLQEFEQRQLAYTHSRSAYRAAQASLSLLQNQLRNELQRAHVSYDISRRLQDDYLVSSSVSGKVYDVLREIGDLVSPQTPLAIIGHSNRFILELQIDEQDIARVKPGLAVVLTLGSHPGQVFDGRLDKIYPIMDEQMRIFRAEASFANPPAALYPNLTAEANIILQTKEKALLIPKEYLVDDTCVWIAKDHKRVVKTGLRDYRKIEILAGLDTSQVIYKPL